jgi:hypothetical protein
VRAAVVGAIHKAGFVVVDVRQTDSSLQLLGPTADPQRISRTLEAGAIVQAALEGTKAKPVVHVIVFSGFSGRAVGEVSLPTLKKPVRMLEPKLAIRLRPFILKSRPALPEAVPVPAPEATQTPAAPPEPMPGGGQARTNPAAPPSGGPSRPPPPPASTAPKAGGGIEGPSAMETASAAGPSEQHPLIADLSLWLGLMHRSLSYSGSGASALNSYSLSASPSIGLQGTFYPIALATNGGLAGLGLTGRFNIEPGITSTNANGDKISTTSNTWEIGPTYRYPLEGWEISGSLIFGGQRFTLSTPASGGPTIPSVTYSYIRPEVATRIELGGVVALSLHLSYLIVTGEGDIKANYFPNATAFGLDAGLGLAWMLSHTWEIRLAGDYRGYYYTLNAQSGATYQASNATDTYLVGTLGVGCRL